MVIFFQIFFTGGSRHARKIKYIEETGSRPAIVVVTPEKKQKYNYNCSITSTIQMVWIWEWEILKCTAIQQLIGGLTVAEGPKIIINNNYDLNGHSSSISRKCRPTFNRSINSYALNKKTGLEMDIMNKKITNSFWGSTLKLSAAQLGKHMRTRFWLATMYFLSPTVPK